MSCASNEPLVVALSAHSTTPIATTGRLRLLKLRTQTRFIGSLPFRLGEVDLAQPIAELPSTAICITGCSARPECMPTEIVETTSLADPTGSNAHPSRTMQTVCS